MKRFTFLLLFMECAELHAIDHNEQVDTVIIEPGKLLIRATNVLVKKTLDETPFYFNGIDNIHAAEVARLV